MYELIMQVKMNNKKKPKNMTSLKILLDIVVMPKNDPGITNQGVTILISAKLDDVIKLHVTEVLVSILWFQRWLTANKIGHW